MRSKILVTLLLLAALTIPACAAEATGSTELINRAAQWDGKAVCYEGEAIGEALPRGDWAWVNVSDGENTIGCYVTRDMAAQIQRYGRYGVRGDTVRLTGTFHRACPEHGGDLDLHVTELRVLQAGHAVAMPVSRALAWASGILGPLAVALIAVAIFRKRCYNED